MAVDLRARLVQRVDRRPGQLQLSSRFERHALAVERRADDLPGLDDGVPAEAGAELGQ